MREEWKEAARLAQAGGVEATARPARKSGGPPRHRAGAAGPSSRPSLVTGKEVDRLRAVGGWDGCLGIHLLEAFTVLLKKDQK